MYCILVPIYLYFIDPTGNSEYITSNCRMISERGIRPSFSCSHNTLDLYSEGAGFGSWQGFRYPSRDSNEVLNACPYRYC